MLLWRLHPNGGQVAVVSVSRGDSERLMRRGWLTINGHRAQTVEVMCDEPLPGRTAIRIHFDEPYPDPHP